MAVLMVFAHLSQLSAQVDADPAIPRGPEAAALIRSTLVTLNDANLTENYSVLRAMAAPDFQARFSVEQLVLLFRGMRARHIDLSGALTLEPVIEGARFHTGQKILQVHGVVHTKPVQLRFGFSYQSIAGKWKLYGLTLDFEVRSREPGAAAINGLGGKTHKGPVPGASLVHAEWTKLASFRHQLN